MKLRAIFLSALMVFSIVGGGVAFGAGVAAAGNDAGNVTASDLNGTGTSENPYQIENWYHLDYINDELDAHYIVVNDIDSSTPGYEALVGNHTENVEINPTTSSFEFGDKIDIPFDNASDYESVSVENYNGDPVDHTVNHPTITIEESASMIDVTYGNASVGWNPIGNDSASFTGSFDGNGHVIEDVVFDRPFGFSKGFFKEVGSTGTVTDVSLNNVSAIGKQGVGGLIGRNSGEVRRVSTSGTVHGTSIHNAEVGGLIGYNDHGLVKDSYSTATVTANGSDKGGLLGNNYHSTVETSYFAGTIYNQTTDDAEGVLIGDNLNSTVADSYWKNETTSELSAVGTRESTLSNVVGLPAANMTGDSAVSNMTAFDWTNTWTPVPNDYPILQFGQYAGGDGSQDNPYQIEDWNDLNNTRENPGANYTLVADLDENTAGYSEVASASANSDKGFAPIPYISGTFDGNDHTIEDLRINRSGESDVGLFGSVDGTVQNLSIVNVNVTGDSRVGGVAGSHGSVQTIENVSVSGTVTGTSNVGGVVGENNGRVKNTESAADVSGGSRVGGLVGAHSRQIGEYTIENSTASGNVTVNEAAEGLTVTSSFGGLVGYNAGGTIKYSNATGGVNGGNLYTGGLVGNNQGGLSPTTVKHSYATGDVNGDSSVGGLIGKNQNDTVVDSYSVGEVTGTTDVGSLVGNNTGANAAVNRSYAAGSVSGVTGSGLVGANESGATVTNSYWDKETTGQSGSAAGTGLTTSEMKGDAAQSNMFDFTNTWVVEDNATHISYPYLVDTTQSPAPGLATTESGTGDYAGGDGSAGYPYRVADGQKPWVVGDNATRVLDPGQGMLYGDVEQSPVLPGNGSEPVLPGNASVNLSLSRTDLTADAVVTLDRGKMSTLPQSGTGELHVRVNQTASDANGTVTVYAEAPVSGEYTDDFDAIHSNGNVSLTGSTIASSGSVVIDDNMTNDATGIILDNDHAKTPEDSTHRFEYTFRETDEGAELVATEEFRPWTGDLRDGVWNTTSNTTDELQHEYCEETVNLTKDTNITQASTCEVDLYSHSFDSNNRVEIDYTVSVTGFDENVSGMGAALLAQQLELNDSQKEQIATGLEEIEVNRLSLSQTANESSSHLDWNAQIDNYDDASVTILGSVLDETGYFETVLDTMDSSSLDQEVGWDASLVSQPDGNVTADATFDYETTNWEEYVTQLEDNGVEVGTTDLEIDLQTEDDLLVGSATLDATHPHLTRQILDGAGSNLLGSSSSSSDLVSLVKDSKIQSADVKLSHDLSNGLTLEVSTVHENVTALTSIAKTLGTELTGETPDTTYFRNDESVPPVYGIVDVADSPGMFARTILLNPPSAVKATPNVSASGYVMTVGSDIEFTASDGPADATYEWDFDGDGTTDETGTTPTYTVTSAGTKTVSLTASNETKTRSKTITIQVRDTTSPTTRITHTGPVQNGTAVEFDASATTDDASVESYEWDFDDDGTTDATGATATHTYDAPGEYTVSVTATDPSGNAETNTTTVLVRGPTATASADSQPFGDTPTNDTSVSTLTITNDGTTPLNIDDVSISGDDAGAFGVLGSPTGAVAPGQSVTIATEYTPSGTSDASATLDVTTNATNYSLPLSGTGVTSDISAGSDDLAFGDVSQGDSETQTVELTNEGDQGTDISAAITGSDTDQFTVESAPTRLDADATDSVTVAFAPTTPGTQAATLTVKNGSDATVATVPLNGTATGPDLELGTDAVDFGEVGKNKTQTETVSLSNYGSESLEVSDVSVDGSDAFTVDDRPDSIAVDGSDTIAVTFEPSAAESYTANLIVESNDANSPENVTLNGTGVGAQVSISSQTANFESVARSEEGYQEINVTNLAKSKTDLHVDRTVINGQDPGPFDVTNGGEFNLSPGETQTLNVSYDPIGTEESNAQLQILSDAGNQQQINVWLSSTDTYIIVEEIENDAGDSTNATVSVDANNVDTESPLSVNVSEPGTRQHAVGFDQLNMSVDSGGPQNFQMDVIHAGNSTQADPTNESETVVEYVELSHADSIPNAQLGDTAIQFRVDKTRLPTGPDTAPDEITFRRYNDTDGWTSHEAELRSETGTHYIYAVETPGFSKFVVSAPSPSESDTSQPSYSTSGGSGGGQITSEPASDISEMELSADTVTLGESIRITGVVENTDYQDGTITVPLTVDGTTVATQSVELSSGDTTSVTFDHTFDSTGTHEVAIGSAPAQTIEVSPAIEETTTTTQPSTPTTTNQTSTAPTTPPEQPTTTPAAPPSTGGGLPYGALLVFGVLAVVIVFLLYRKSDR